MDDTTLFFHFMNIMSCCFYKVVKLIEQFGANKIAFGTNTPILEYLTSRIRIESLKEEEADEKTKELIRSGNTRRLLSL